MKTILGVMLGACMFVATTCTPKQAHAQEQVGAQWKLTRSIDTKNSARDIAVLPQSAIVAVDGFQRVDLWDTDTGKNVGTLFKGKGEESDYVSGMAFSVSGETLAVGCRLREAGRIAFFDIATKKEIYSHTLDLAPSALVYSHDGKYLAYSVGREENKRRVEILDVESKKVIHQLEARRNPIKALAWQEGDKFLVGAGGGSAGTGFGPQNCDYTRWDVATGKLVAYHLLSPGSTNSVFNDAGTLLATMGAEVKVENSSLNWIGSSVTAYSIPQNNEEPTPVTQMTGEFLLRHFPSWGPNMTWSPDSKLLAIPQGDYKKMNLLLWDGHSETSVTPRIAAGGELKNDAISINHAKFWKSGDKMVVAEYASLLIWTRENNK